MSGPGEASARAFLDALSELSRQHGFVIWACDNAACCGGVNVRPMQTGKEGGRYTARAIPGTPPAMDLDSVRWELST